MKGIYLLAVIFLSGIQIDSVYSQIVNCAGNNYKKFAYPGSNLYYFYCSNNLALLSKCRKNSYYNTKSEACVSSTVDTYPIQQLCQWTESQTLPVPTNCQSYIQCGNRVGYLQSCPTGLFYDESEQGCTAAASESCSSTSNIGTCTQQNQILPDPSNCQKYIQCLNGQAYRQSCPTGSYYDSSELGCTSTVPASCSRTTPIGTCTQENQILPDPRNCQNYVQCVNGQAYSQSCPTGLYYDSSEQGCTSTVPASCSGIAPIGPCTEQNLISADPNSCENYIECFNGQAYLQSCPTGLYYDPSEEDCTPTAPDSCIEATPIGTCSQENQNLANPSNCQSYIQCIDGQAYLKSCPSGLYYDSSDQDCTAIDAGSCSAITPIGTCSDQYQITADPSNCHNFIQCINGEVYSQSCPSGLYYDPSEQSCSSIDPTSCSGSNPTATCTLQNQILADPNNCQKYIRCVNGNPYSQSCPSGLYYDSLKQGCTTTVPASCSGTTPIGTCTQVNEFLADPSNCQNYIQCVNGKSYTQSCPSNFYYDPPTQSCGRTMPVSCKSSTPTTTCTVQNQLTTDPSNCQKYFICINGQNLSGTCPLNYYFHPTTQKCDPTVPSRCSSAPQPGTGCSSQNQLSADPTNCQRYYQCMNGQKILNTCPGGYYFHTSTLSCGPTVATSC